MKHKWIIITLSIIFFLGSLTFWANQVFLPTIVKKIAIEQAQNFLKRKVEIESIHFSWVKGIVINNIKIYQKDSLDKVFLQAERISSGILFVPGVKTHKLILTSLNIDSLSVLLVHQTDTWNFSDLLIIPQTSPSSRPSPVDVSVGGITINNGKFRVDDIQGQSVWSEIIDPINLKVGLSLSGISFDGQLTIPQKQASISLQGSYQIPNQSLKAQVNIKNIKPQDYFRFYPGPLPFSLTNGLMEQVNAHIQYAPDDMRLTGSWSIKNVETAFDQQSFKGELQATNADITLKKNDIAFKGNFSLLNTQITTPLLSGSGTLSARIEHGRWQENAGSLEGSVALKQGVVSLGEHEKITGEVQINKIKVSKDKNLTQANFELNLDQLNVNLPEKKFVGTIHAPQMLISLDSKNIVRMDGTLDVMADDAAFDKTILQGKLHCDQLKINFDQTQQILDAQSRGILEGLTIKLEDKKEIHTNAHFDLKTLYPLKNPSGMKYSGTLALENTDVQGLPFGPINNVKLTADVKTNSIDLQSLSLMVLDTTIIASGNISDFSKPLLNIQAQSERFDLSKLQTLAPDLLKAQGLTVDGTTSFMIKFEGPALDPLTAKINAQAVLKDVNLESSTLKQKLNHISGTIKADGNSLSWDNFTAVFMDKALTLTGHLMDFKNPQIKTSLSFDGIEIKGEINKNDNLIELKSLSGEFLSAQLNASGSVDISGKTPQLSIKSTFKCNLEDASRFLPQLKSTLEPLKLTGLLSMKASLSGPASQWMQWNIDANASSDLVTISGFKLNNLNVDVNQEDSKIKKFTITSGLYEGSLNVVTTADLNDAMPFDTALHVENVDLSKLKNDIGAKDEDLRGFISLTSIIKGTIKDLLNLKGSGSLNVAQGYLMKKEFSSIFLIAELSNLIFTDATANFDIANQKVSTENFALKSEGAILHGKGSIGFDKKIQAELSPEFNTDKIIRSGSIKKGPSALIALAADKYLTFTIDGTIDKPIIHTIKRPSALIKKTGEIITENVGQILQGIFQ